MNTILQEIVDFKRKETAERKSLYPVRLLERSLYFQTQTVSLEQYIQRKDLQGIIAEFKRRSPSKGTINAYADPVKTSLAYMQAGASALSVLTDACFFGGKNTDLEAVRKVNYCPVLRKEFVLEEYQIIEAKSIGADAVLLIAAILTKAQIQQLAALAFSLGLEVLLEIHSENELDKLGDGIRLLGVNNRDLHSFKVDINQSLRIAEKVKKEIILISESGINIPADLHQLRNAGFSGFLIGEHFMSSADPGKAAERFISQCKNYSLSKEAILA
jgi:indole-3-glycerol phosphate synthase